MKMALLLNSITGGLTTSTFTTSLMLAIYRAIAIFAEANGVLGCEHTGTTGGGGNGPGFL